MCIRDRTNSSINSSNSILKISIFKNRKDDCSSIALIHLLFTFSLKKVYSCLLYTSDAADERSSVDLGGRRIIKKKKKKDKHNDRLI